MSIKVSEDLKTNLDFIRESCIKKFKFRENFRIDDYNDIISKFPKDFNKENIEEIKQTYLSLNREQQKLLIGDFQDVELYYNENLEKDLLNVKFGLLSKRFSSIFIYFIFIRIKSISKVLNEYILCIINWYKNTIKINKKVETKDLKNYNEINDELKNENLSESEKNDLLGKKKLFEELMKKYNKENKYLEKQIKRFHNNMLQYPNGSIDSICEDDYYSICDKGYSLPELVSLLPEPVSEPLIEPSLFIEENETNKPMTPKTRNPMTLKTRNTMTLKTRKPMTPKTRKPMTLKTRKSKSRKPVPTSERSILYWKL
jgi:hypothetical protein